MAEHFADLEYGHIVLQCMGGRRVPELVGMEILWNIFACGMGYLRIFFELLVHPFLALFHPVSFVLGIEEECLMFRVAPMLYGNVFSQIFQEFLRQEERPAHPTFTYYGYECRILIHVQFSNLD